MVNVTWDYLEKKKLSQEDETGLVSEGYCV